MKIGKQQFNTEDVMTIIITLIAIAVISAVYTIMEFRYFTEWVVQRSVGIDPIHPLMTFNWVSILVLFAVFALIMFLIQRSINMGRMDLAVSFVAAGAASFIVYLFIRSAILGVLPINSIEWEIWVFHTQMAFLPGYYMPGWWLVVFGLVIMGMMWTYYSTYKNRGRRF